MVRSIVVFCLVAACAAPAAASHGSQSSGTSSEIVPVLDGLGTLRHPVSTANAEAQRFFDQGLRLVFGFNHDEAVRAFEKAAALDPKLGMAWWGVALALGPNINLPMDAEHGERAFRAVQKALALGAEAPAHEKDYIAALAERYSDDPKADRRALDVAYKNAMGRLVARYPDDLDLATLYAESAMDLSPWQYWKPDGSPNEGTPELLQVLESVLRRDPNHIGANHYYIHAVEASPNPERALAAAKRLEGLTPGAGHLVHMPSHIYIRLGDYDASAALNDDASAVDSAYIATHGIEGIYPAMYYNHNMHFSAVSHALAGRYGPAMAAARRVTEHSAPMVAAMPMIEMFTPTSTLVQILFRRWDEILALPDPGDGFPITRIIWHFARGMAHATAGRPAEADAELQAVIAGTAAMPAEATIGLNPATNVLAVPRGLLAARILSARGDTAEALAELGNTVPLEDALNYDEPPDWYLHVRPSLGALLLRNGRAAEAEKVFRDDLARRPRDGRALFGLQKAVEAQGREYDASLIQVEHEAAWRGADRPATLDDL